MTVAMAIGKHNLSVAPIIIVLIIIGVAIYFVWKRRTGKPNGRGK
jgi:heme/copper-type cytochrome/quinol oxidase subunit 2